MLGDTRPNDPEELTNQAEWLGRMSRTHMLAAYFIHDTDGWRLKGHARGPMVSWMSEWAVALRKPSDVGGDDTGYILPGLEIVPHLIPVHIEQDGALFAAELGGVQGRAEVRRLTLADRVALTAELVAGKPDEPWLLWCGLNGEADALAARIPGAVNVHGSLDPDEKARLLRGFADGDYRVLITKPSIASQGLNYQHCARMAFVGPGDSYEQYYQAIRRCYRYGQSRVVEAHVVLSDLESQIAANVARKERQANEINRRADLRVGPHQTEGSPHERLHHRRSRGPKLAAATGDSCERMAEIATESVDLSICSPPFASLFTYSPSIRDLGNSSSRTEFIEHYKFIIREQLRVTPGP